MTYELPSLATRRLVLRPVGADDLDLLVELNSDPAVMAHLLGRAASPEETRVEWDRRLDRQSDPSRGLGYWLGWEGDAFVGWWSASHYAPRPEVSGIGYRLRVDGWGRGLATEGARAMVAQAFSCAGVSGVFASTLAVNTASRRVLERIGLVHTSTWTTPREGTIDGADLGEVGYELGRDDWERDARTG